MDDVKMVETVLLQRANLLQANIPEKFKVNEIVEVIRKISTGGLENHIKTLYSLKSIELYFALDFSIIATRCWEAWKKDDDNKYVFQQFDLPYYREEISKSWNHLSSSTQIFDKITSFSDSESKEEFSPILDNAYQSLRSNIGIIQSVCPDVKNIQDLDRFLSAQTVYLFRSFFIQVAGFSSFDGSRLYLNQDYIKRLDYWQKIIEHESINNISRYFDKLNQSLDYGKISPLKNSILKKKDNMIESGHEMKKLNLDEPENSSPFRLFEIETVKAL